MCAHIYNAGGHNLRFNLTGKNNAQILGYVKYASDGAGKLLYIGEFGDSDPHIMDDKNALFTQNMFLKIADLNIPFSSPWIWDFYQFNTYEYTPFHIEQGFTDLIIGKYMDANVALGNDQIVIAEPDIIKPQVVLTYPEGDRAFANPQLVHAVASDNSGNSEIYVLNNNESSDIDDSKLSVVNYQLSNYPNPFNNKTVVSYQLLTVNDQF